MQVILARNIFCTKVHCTIDNVLIDLSKVYFSVEPSFVGHFLVHLYLIMNSFMDC